MDFETPDSLYYLETHEWTAIDGDTARIGITDFAQDELGDVVLVELPEVGETFQAGDQFGSIESIKAISDLYTSVSGTVTAVNTDLEDSPELVNENPYGDGWMIEIELEDESELDEALTAEEYSESIY